MVKSKSGSTLYHYKCDDRCPQHKSLHICSHTVAAAESNGEFQQFFEWYCKNQGNRQARMTQMATHGMPTGVGRKGGRAPRKKGRALLSTDENRVPPQCNQALVISGSGNSGTQIVTNASRAEADTRPPFLMPPLLYLVFLALLRVVVAFTPLLQHRLI